MGCVEAAPEFFAYDEAADAVVVLRDRATAEDIREALNVCPKDCIILE
jgi:ferredoxin